MLLRRLLRVLLDSAAKNAYQLLLQAADLLSIPIEPYSDEADLRTPPDVPDSFLTDGPDANGLITFVPHSKAIEGIVEQAEAEIPLAWDLGEDAYRLPQAWSS